MACPLCGQRKARRACPALQQDICAVCCGTKRLIEIRCPSDCPYLASSREHPPAVTVRQQQRDVTLLLQFMRDFSEQQTRLFLITGAFLIRYQPAELQPLIDDDVAGAAGALAATFETASRGVIYEHRPPSAPAERLMAALKPLLAEAGGAGGTSVERDAGVVLRRMEEAVGTMRGLEPGNRRALLELLARMTRKGPSAEAADEAPRLIVP